MRRTVQALLKKVLILLMTRLSICQESMGTVLSSLPKTVIPIFCKENVSPIAETTPMHLPLSAAFGLAGCGAAAAGGFVRAGCWAIAAPSARKAERRTIAAQRMIRGGMVVFPKRRERSSVWISSPNLRLLCDKHA